MIYTSNASKISRNRAKRANYSGFLVLGLLQFFSGHIDRLAEMAAPFYEVLVSTAWNKPK
jgi:hypothetical protein